MYVFNDLGFGDFGFWTWAGAIFECRLFFALCFPIVTCYSRKFSRGGSICVLELTGFFVWSFVDFSSKPAIQAPYNNTSMTCALVSLFSGEGGQYANLGNVTMSVFNDSGKEENGRWRTKSLVKIFDDPFPYAKPVSLVGFITRTSVTFVHDVRMYLI